jgi:hypothetical protein
VLSALLQVGDGFRLPHAAGAQSGLKILFLPYYARA